MKYEKLTFTPTRLIEIERTGEPGEKPWDSVVLKPGREVTFKPVRDWLYDDYWYIDCGRVYCVPHCDVERVYAQLSMEADVAAKAAHAAESVPDRLLRIARDAGHEPTGSIPVAPLGMVSTVITSQVAAGGVDTEGTRHEAERWCAWLCECVCEGMRATTEESALGLVPDRRLTSGKVIRGDLQWWNTAPEFGGKRMTRMRGKPLGRP